MPETLRWPSLCASTLATLALSGRLQACFFQAIHVNRFGLIDGPAIGQHLIETRIVGIELY